MVGNEDRGRGGKGEKKPNHFLCWVVFQIFNHFESVGINEPLK